MSRRLPPLSWLRAFEASARHLSFTHAAAELGLTQAAISKQVKALELHLHEPLFQRGPRSLVLTKVGAAYLPKVRDAFERLALGTDELFGSRRSEVLTVRAAVGFSVTWIAPRLIRYRERHPGRRLRIVSSIWNEEFDRERFDLDIRYGRGGWPKFRTDRLTWERLTPLCSPALPAGTPPLGEPRDLRHHALLHVLGYEQGWATWLSAAGVEGIDPGSGLQFDTSLLAFEVAASGGGVVLGRSSMSAGVLASGRLVAPFELSVEVEEAFHLLSPLDGREHADAAGFRAWLLDEAAAERPAGPG
ncbi:LysR substrate-binding domain-containing protein [Tistlia consotensis]|nr:LysR substrate-binding domain-containing protein [Tistlia consotensis]